LLAAKPCQVGRPANEATQTLQWRAFPQPLKFLVKIFIENQLVAKAQ
jgi:hypothetical protein